MAATATTTVSRQASFRLRTVDDVASARRGVRDWAKELGLSIVDLTKIVTAASELARNAIVHGGGGVMCLQIVKRAEREGLRLTFKDRGPGIESIELAMTDGYTSGGGMGIGLPGAKRLVNEFDMSSDPSEGTCITILRWKH